MMSKIISKKCHPLSAGGFMLFFNPLWHFVVGMTNVGIVNSAIIWTSLVTHQYTVILQQQIYIVIQTFCGRERT